MSGVHECIDDFKDHQYNSGSSSSTSSAEDNLSIDPNYQDYNFDPEDNLSDTSTRERSWLDLNIPPLIDIPNIENTAHGWASKYLDSEYTDPSDKDYSISSDDTPPTDDHRITCADPPARQELYYNYHACNEEIRTVAWWADLFHCNYINYWALGVDSDCSWAYSDWDPEDPDNFEEDFSSARIGTGMGSVIAQRRRCRQQGISFVEEDNLSSPEAEFQDQQDTNTNQGEGLEEDEGAHSGEDEDNEHLEGPVSPDEHSDQIKSSENCQRVFIIWLTTS